MTTFTLVLTLLSEASEFRNSLFLGLRPYSLAQRVKILLISNPSSYIVCVNQAKNDHNVCSSKVRNLIFPTCPFQISSVFLLRRVPTESLPKRAPSQSSSPRSSFKLPKEIPCMTSLSRWVASVNQRSLAWQIKGGLCDKQVSVGASEKHYDWAADLSVSP